MKRWDHISMAIEGAVAVIGGRKIEGQRGALDITGADYIQIEIREDGKVLLDQYAFSGVRVCCIRGGIEIIRQPIKAAVWVETQKTQPGSSWFKLVQLSGEPREPELVHPGDQPLNSQEKLRSLGGLIAYRRRPSYRQTVVGLVGRRRREVVWVLNGKPGSGKTYQTDGPCFRQPGSPLWFRKVVEQGSF